MIPLTLGEIAEITHGTLVGDADASTIVSGEVHTDSRLVPSGGLFFALPGQSTDGHNFVDAAAAAGAALAVTERQIATTIPQIVVADGVIALADLAREVVARVKKRGNLAVVGITGSNGKTTTKNLVRAICESVAPTVAPAASFNNHVGAPISMLRIDFDTRFLIVEMGASHKGEIRRLVNIARPDIGVVLQVGLAHVGEFGGPDAIQKAKSEMVTDLPASSVAVLNADDPRVMAMADLTAARVRTFGRVDSADIRAIDIEATAAGTSFTVVAGQSRFPVHLNILGEHHVSNALAALTVAVELGIDLGRAVPVLESVQSSERWRMQVLHAPSGAIVINDAYNASPDSMAAALKTLAQIVTPGQRTIAVLGEMAELGDHAREEHDRIGRLAVRLNIRQLIVVGHGARHIHNAAGLEGSWDGESILVDSADDAFALLNPQLGPGDVVLVKASNVAGLRALGDRLGGVSA